MPLAQNGAKNRERFGTLSSLEAPEQPSPRSARLLPYPEGHRLGIPLMCHRMAPDGPLRRCLEAARTILVRSLMFASMQAFATITRSTPAVLAVKLCLSASYN